MINLLVCKSDQNEATMGNGTGGIYDKIQQENHPHSKRRFGQFGISWKGTLKGGRICLFCQFKFLSFLSYIIADEFIG
jgi:hypothetical protein